MTTQLDNPIAHMIAHQEPFVYFHTHEITQAVLDRVLIAGKSIEIDVSVHENGEVYIGHPPAFYAYKQLPPPANLSLSAVLDQLQDTDVYIVLDCKDVRALPTVRKIIERFGVHRILFYSWIDELLFTPYSASMTIEPHWLHEDLPILSVQQLYAATGVPIVLGCRGLSDAKLRQSWPMIYDRIVEVHEKTQCIGVHFNLPGFALPQAVHMRALIDEGIVPWVNVDHVLSTARPSIYVGATDNIDQASVPRYRSNSL